MSSRIKSRLTWPPEAKEDQIQEPRRQQFPPTSRHDHDEVVKQVNGVMKLWEEGRCLVPGSKANLIGDSELFAAFGGNADAWFLFSKIKMTWGNRLKPFPISDSRMTEEETIPGWKRQRYRTATKALEQIGLITLFRQGRGQNHCSLYVWDERVRQTYTK